VRLSLGEREILVETGQAAEFGTMTPHAFAASTAPPLIMIFDRDGQRAHVHHETCRERRDRIALARWSSLRTERSLFRRPTSGSRIPERPIWRPSPRASRL
jgi:hypothetical protein